MVTSWVKNAVPFVLDTLKVSVKLATSFATWIWKKVPVPPVRAVIPEVAPAVTVAKSKSDET